MDLAGLPFALFRTVGIGRKAANMTRYYFHIRDGEHLTEDDEGIELVDLIAAQAEAILSAGDVSRQRPGPEWAGIKSSIVITNEVGAFLGDFPVPSFQPH
jgi:hypothetical protein